MPRNLRNSSTGQIAVLVSAILAVCIFTACTKTDRQHNATLEKITLAYSTPPYTVLIDVALKQGYFREAGLDVTPKQYAYGKVAFDSLLRGEADFATAGETPLVFAVIKGEKISIIATIQSSNRNNAIIARKDSGIVNPSDLKGKKIAATFGTVGEFFMDDFLVSHGISRKEMHVVNLTPAAMQDALANGSVDAVSLWSPEAIVLRRQLGDEVSVFYEPDIYTQTFSIVARQDYVGKNPANVKKVLSALIRSEGFIRENPDEARKIVAEATKIDRQLIDEMWLDNSFGVTLDQSLLLAMEDESLWAIKNGLVKNTGIPNYLDYIYVDGLASVEPKAVRILR